MRRCEPFGRSLRARNTWPRRSEKRGREHPSDQLVESNPALVRHAQQRAQNIQNRVADRITAFSGSMNFVYLHVALFVIRATLLERKPAGPAPEERSAPDDRPGRGYQYRAVAIAATVMVRKARESLANVFRVPWIFAIAAPCSGVGGAPESAIAR